MGFACELKRQLWGGQCGDPLGARNSQVSAWTGPGVMLGEDREGVQR